jgi:ethanolamine utilization protein EutP (predicted NTPase)
MDIQGKSMLRFRNAIHLLAVILFVLIVRGVSQEKTLPPDFEQILPRGRIAAITNPDFVSADDAVIAPDSWVLGVVIGGEARAYNLNLLNYHEVVNDQINDTHFAAVW